MWMSIYAERSSNWEVAAQWCISRRIFEGKIEFSVLLPVVQGALSVLCCCWQPARSLLINSVFVEDGGASKSHGAWQQRQRGRKTNFNLTCHY